MINAPIMNRTITNPVIKDKVTFVKTSEETNGKLTELEIMLQPAGKNELHYHTSYSETFTAVEGNLGVQLSKKKSIILEPGESYTVEKGEIHAFFNPENRKITFKVELKPGHSGFEQALRILYGLGNDGLLNKKGLPKNIRHLAVIARLSDMRSPSLLLKTMHPLLNFLGRRAEKNGFQQKLIDTYCKLRN